MIFDLALAAALIWLGHHRRIRPWGLFALYVAGYSGYRIFEETIRIDSSEHFLGLRLNLYVATIMTLFGIAWFIRAQRRSGDDQLEPATGATGPAGGIAGSLEGDSADAAAGVPDRDHAVTPGPQGTSGTQGAAGSSAER